MLIILPDPTTRYCPYHRDQLMTDTRPCWDCKCERVVADLRAMMEYNLARYLQRTHGN